jgi:hypothetical protein
MYGFAMPRSKKSGRLEIGDQRVERGAGRSALSLDPYWGYNDVYVKQGELF